MSTPTTEEAPPTVNPLDLVNPLPFKEATSFTSRIVGVRFKDSGRVYDFDAGEIPLLRGDAVVCETSDRGPMLGFVSKPPFRIFPAETLRLKLSPVTRMATDADKEARLRHEKQEEETLSLAQRAVNDRKLPMRVVDVEFTLNGKSAFVYFSSDDRVDFRDLLKDLIYQIKTRVELRQIGPRDETKRIGAIGPCGQETCCSKFLNKFEPVSIKMAKDQGLALNPTKVSGMCGRLKCCLAYEQDVYVQAKKGLPKIGGCVKCSSGGCGTVGKLDVLKQLVTVFFDDGTSQTLPVTEVMEDNTLKPKPTHKVVAAQNWEPKEEKPVVPVPPQKPPNQTSNMAPKGSVIRFVDGKPVADDE